MYLKLNHQKLDIYSISSQLVFECYRFIGQLPVEEKFAMAAQIRRAALSVHLNIAEGSSRKSPGERKRYYEVARGSVIEIDAALDIAAGLGYLKDKDNEQLGKFIINCFKILSGMIEPKTKTT